MNFYPEADTYNRNKIKFELSWIIFFNYTTKCEVKKATGVDTLKFAKKAVLSNLKCDADKLGIIKRKTVPFNIILFTTSFFGSCSHAPYQNLEN